MADIRDEELGTAAVQDEESGELDEEIIALARVLVVAYWLGHKGQLAIPETVEATISKGHDGLNWQKFAPLAKDILARRAAKTPTPSALAVRAPNANYKINPARVGVPETGVFVRAQQPDGGWDSVDIAHLDRPSLDAWLRSRETLDWPVDVVMILLGHPRKS